MTSKVMIIKENIASRESHLTSNIVRTQVFGQNVTSNDALFKKGYYCSVGESIIVN